MNDKTKLEIGKVYAVSITDIEPKIIKYVEGSYGTWKNDYDWQLKGLLLKDKEELVESYTLVRYLGDNLFEEYYTEGQINIYLDDIYEYKNDTVDKYLFIKVSSLKEVTDTHFSYFGTQQKADVSSYLTDLYNASKENIELRIKTKITGDYIRAIGENLYYDYVRKKTR